MGDGRGRWQSVPVQIDRSRLGISLLVVLGGLALFTLPFLAVLSPAELDEMMDRIEESS